MAKEVSLKITIDKDGKIHMAPDGTEGNECLELMKCIEEINGFNTVETLMHEDASEKKAQVVRNQKVGQ